MTTSTQLSGLKRRHVPLGQESAATLADFRSKPDALFGPHDLAAAGIVGSRSGLHNALRRGRLPKPLRLPSGRMAWRGKVLADWLDRLETGAAS